jgi:hypothetical protein
MSTDEKFTAEFNKIICGDDYMVRFYFQTTDSLGTVSLYKFESGAFTLYSRVNSIADTSKVFSS